MHSICSSAAALAFFGALVIAPRADAIVYDLTTQSTVVVPTAYGSAIFTRDFTKPAGTGVFNPFLTIQAKGSEQGYNSNTEVFDTKRAPQWNHDIRLSDLTTVQIDGAEYYSFVIDINEPNGGSKSEISFEMLKVYTTPTGNQSTTDIDSLGTKRFDLDLPTDNYIRYDDQNSGSGEADIAFFIPTSAFLSGPNAAQSTDYVYMFQRFGDHISADFDGSTQGGFEETAIGPGMRGGAIPEVASLLPLAGVLGLVISAHRRRGRAA